MGADTANMNALLASASHVGTLYYNVWRRNLSELSVGRRRSRERDSRTYQERAPFPYPRGLEYQTDS